MPRSNFTLFLLGTETEFNPILKSITSLKTTITDFPKGELLSVIASLIRRKTATSESESPLSPNPTIIDKVAYFSEEVAVINGPNARGSNIRTKIGHSLALVLNAIADGKNVQIAGHSRGAVESILVAHEVQAIQEIFLKTPEITFQGLLATLEEQGKQRKTQGANTGCIIHALKELLPKSEAEQADWLKRLQENIQESTLSLFNIDPVPGEKPLTWWDIRFFTIPKNVKKSLTIVCSKERSYLGFSALHAQPEDPSKSHEKITIPAHHGGISSGNNASQQKKRYEGKTTHAHKLGVFKLLEFLSDEDVEFDDARLEQIFEKGRAMGRSFLSFIRSGTEAIHVKNFNFKEIYRKIYTKIKEHFKDYEAIKQSNYAYMFNGAKRFMLSSQGYIDLDVAFPAIPGYVNSEHQKLNKAYLAEKLQLNKSDDLGAFLTQFTQTIAKKLEDQSFSSEYLADFLEIIGICLNEARGKYLEDLGDDVSKLTQKKHFYTQITAAFKQISALTHPIATQIKEQCIKTMILTFEEQQQSIQQSLDFMQASTEEKLKEFFSNLINDMNKRENKTISTDISDILKCPEFQALPESNIHSKIEFICEKLHHKTLVQQPLELLLTAWERSKESTSLEDLEHTSLADMSKLHALLKASSPANPEPSSPSSFGLCETSSGDDLEPASPASPKSRAATPDTPSEAHLLMTDQTREVPIQSRRLIEQTQINHLSKRFERQYPTIQEEDLKTLYTKINGLLLDIRSIRHLFSKHGADVSTLEHFEAMVNDKKAALVKLFVQFFPTAETLRLSESFETHCERAKDSYRQKLIADQVQFMMQIVENDKISLAEQKDIEYQELVQLEQQLRAKIQQPLSLETQILEEEKEAQCVNAIQQIREFSKGYSLYLTQCLANTASEERKKPIENKIKILNTLLEKLNDFTNHPKASQRLEQFFKELNQENCNILKQHRDNPWARFCYNVSKAVAFIAGICALGVPLFIYTKKGNSLSFWNSKGSEFVKNVKSHQSIIDDMNPGDEIKPLFKIK